MRYLPMFLFVAFLFVVGCDTAEPIQNPKTVTVQFLDDIGFQYHLIHTSGAMPVFQPPCHKKLTGRFNVTLYPDSTTHIRFWGGGGSLKVGSKLVDMENKNAISLQPTEPIHITTHLIQSENVTCRGGHP